MPPLTPDDLMPLQAVSTITKPYKVSYQNALNEDSSLKIFEWRVFMRGHQHGLTNNQVCCTKKITRSLPPVVTLRELTPSGEVVFQRGGIVRIIERS